MTINQTSFIKINYNLKIYIKLLIDSIITKTYQNIALISLPIKFLTLNNFRDLLIIFLVKAYYLLKNFLIK